MDCIKKEEVTLEQYEMSDDSIPSWALTLFTKVNLIFVFIVHMLGKYIEKLTLQYFSIYR